MRNQIITLSDIASKLSVSTVTVSKALRNHPDISKNMTQKVKNAAKKMGYIPNKAASMLSARKTNTIGLIVPKIAHSFFSSLIESIYNHARENNYEIILTSSQEDSELEKKNLLTMISMKVDGILISVTRDTNDKSIYGVVKKNKIPIVEIDRTVDDSLTKVVFDDIGGTFQAVSYAIEKGFSRIAFVGGNHKANIGKDRLSGYLRALKKHKIKRDNTLIVHGGFKEADGYSALKMFYEQDNLPELIFAVTYPVALGVISAAKELKLKIPRDIDLISFGDSEFNRFIYPPISYVNQKTDEMGRIAVDKIIKKIESSEILNSEKIIISSKFILKGTCKFRGK
ncbi:HTH-type transcriptional repressor CytR [bacterium BMS3Abin04]|nr:HTH-type transcriptional repressor CytR [bacterium BMS3Abin04]